MKKISIILPIYNTEKYLKRCLDSLVNQTIKEIEIIAINDNSTDNSLNILRDYQHIYGDKIKIISNDPNVGAGASRNKGLEQAVGDYIGFVDSDDYIEPDMMEILYNQACKNNYPDIVRCGFKTLLGNMDIAFLLGKRTIHENGIISPEQNKTYIYTETPACWNKLLRKDFVSSTKFPENLKWEDYPFTIFLLGKANKVVFLNDIKYTHRHNLDNTTVNDIIKPKKRILDIFTASDILEQNYRDGNLYEIYKEEIRISQIINCLERVRDINFSIKISFADKKRLTNAILNIIEIKYGDWQNLPAYIQRKAISRFYRYRMNLIENYMSDKKDRQETEEESVNQKVKTIMKKYD